MSWGFTLKDESFLSFAGRSKKDLSCLTVTSEFNQISIEQFIVSTCVVEPTLISNWKLTDKHGSSKSSTLSATVKLVTKIILLHPIWALKIWRFWLLPRKPTKKFWRWSRVKPWKSIETVVTSSTRIPKSFLAWNWVCCRSVWRCFSWSNQIHRVCFREAFESHL